MTDTAASTRPTHPSTILVVHPKERRSKCSLEPLRNRPGFVFWTFPDQHDQPLDQYVRLGMGGPPIGPDDAHQGLLVLDGTWRLVAKMEPDYTKLPIRSLPPLQTAYPRRSKTLDDPDNGLASVEALFAAYHLMGRPTDGLLDHYRWANQFLAANSSCLNNHQTPPVPGPAPFGQTSRSQPPGKPDDVRKVIRRRP